MVRIARHFAHDDLSEIGVETRREELRGLGTLEGYFEEELVERVRVERDAAGDHLVADDAHGVEIAPVIDRLSPRLLGRHVIRRAHYGARSRHAERVVVEGGEFRHAEVDELDERW